MEGGERRETCFCSHLEHLSWFMLAFLHSHRQFSLTRGLNPRRASVESTNFRRQALSPAFRLPKPLMQASAALSEIRHSETGGNTVWFCPSLFVVW